MCFMSSKETYALDGLLDTDFNIQFNIEHKQKTISTTVINI